jgi:hypothetical protein
MFWNFEVLSDDGIVSFKFILTEIIPIATNIITFILLLISRALAGLGGSNLGAAQAYISDITSNCTFFGSITFTPLSCRKECKSFLSYGL